jgi:hypothetical protein
MGAAKVEAEDVDCLIVTTVAGNNKQQSEQSVRTTYQD